MGPAKRCAESESDILRAALAASEAALAEAQWKAEQTFAAIIFELKAQLAEADNQATDFLDQRNHLMREMGAALQDLERERIWEGQRWRYPRTVESVVHERLLRAIEAVHAANEKGA